MEESFLKTLESPLSHRPQSEPVGGAGAGESGRTGCFLHEKVWGSVLRFQSLVPAESHEAAVHAKPRVCTKEMVSG